MCQEVIVEGESIFFSLLPGSEVTVIKKVPETHHCVCLVVALTQHMTKGKKVIAKRKEGK